MNEQHSKPTRKRTLNAMEFCGSEKFPNTISDIKEQNWQNLHRPQYHVASALGDKMFRRALIHSLAMTCFLAVNMAKMKAPKPALPSWVGSEIRLRVDFKRAPSSRTPRRGARQSKPTYSAMTKETPKFKLVEGVNELTLSSFVEAFAPKNALVVPSTPNLAKNPIQLSFESSASLSLRTLEACFTLIEESSADHYRTGGVGWHPAQKKDEMRLPDLKYFLVKRKYRASGGKDGERVEGFMSFMITYEDGKEVNYCYEIHLSPALRGSGLGKHLMGVFEEIGRNSGMEKTMLTVFKRNQDAMGFYGRLGYIVDEFTPQPKILRNGTVKESTYVVLSKQLRNGKDTEGTSKHGVDKDVD